MQLIRLTIFRSDTISGSCKEAGERFKLDLCLVMLEDDKLSVDNSTAEIAKKATVKSFFKDKLKSTIVSKCHLNSFIKEVPFIQAKDVPSIKMPIIQITGFSGKLSVISLAKKQEYKLEDVCSFKFPTSLQQIQSRSIQELVDFLFIVDVR